MDELEAIEALESLEWENTTDIQGKGLCTLRPKFKTFLQLNLFPNIDLFIKIVTEEFQKISTFISHDNLTRIQCQALKELQELPVVVNKPADKGGNIVILPVRMYQKESSS